MQNSNNRLYELKSKKRIVNNYNSKRCNNFKNHNKRVSKRVINNRRQIYNIMYRGGQPGYRERDIYYGSLVGNMKEGYGKMVYKDGKVYEGEWKDDKFNGKGRMKWPNDKVYEGEYKEGNMHGIGKFIWADGKVYEGQWQNDQPNGKGTMTWSNGSVYEGEWKDGKQHGKGKTLWVSGTFYEGDYYKGDRHGNGKLMYYDGTLDYITQGEHKNNKLYNGTYTLFGETGKSAVRQFINGSAYHFDKNVDRFLITAVKLKIDETKHLTIYMDLHGSDLTNTQCTIKPGKHIRVIAPVVCGLVNAGSRKSQTDSINILYNVFHLNQNNEFSTYQKLNKIIEMHNEINNNLIDQYDGFRQPLYDHRYRIESPYKSIYIIDTNDISKIEYFLPSMRHDNTGLYILSNKIDKIVTIDNVEKIDILPKLMPLLDIDKTNRFLRSNLINVLFNLGYDTINIFDNSCRLERKHELEYNNDDTLNYTCIINNEPHEVESDVITSSHV
jgi:hypothetical protein